MRFDFFNKMSKEMVFSSCSLSLLKGICLLLWHIKTDRWSVMHHRDGPGLISSAGFVSLTPV